MHSKEFESVVVQKPWGFEYLLYYNSHIEIWFLHIDKDQRTSLHCHPNKLTSLIVLNGEAEITFLSDTQRLSTLNKIIMRPGLFHSTHCLSDGLDLLEFESPPDKSDLVRLEDQYGRAGESYEKPERYIPDLGKIKFTELDRDYYLGACKMRVVRPSKDTVFGDVMLAVLSGGLVAGNGKLVLSAGDIVSSKIFARLIKSFSLQDLELLILSKNE